MQSLQDVIKLFLSVATSCEGGWDGPENEALLEVRKHGTRFAREYEQLRGRRQPFRTSQKLLRLAALEARPREQIWLLENSAVPLVLRPVEKRLQSESGSTDLAFQLIR